jgi:integrase
MKVRKLSYVEAGQKKLTTNWYAIFMCRGWKCRVPLLRDKRQSDELARKIDKLNEIRAAAGVTPAELRRYVETEMPPSVRTKLAKLGVLDASSVAAGQALTVHFTDYKAHLEARGRNPEYIATTSRQLLRIAAGCGWVVWTDITPTSFDRWLNDLREGVAPLAESAEKRKDGKAVVRHKPIQVSDRTANSYLVAIKGFCNWMVRIARRASESPMIHLTKRDEIKQKRGPFTVDEVRRLLRAAESGPAWRDIPGAERSIVYRLAVETGMRARELRLLTRSSFHLEDERPVVVVEKMTTKGKRQRTIPLRADTAALLKKHLANKLPLAPALRIPDKNATARMIYEDMERAGIPKTDAEGRVRVFHSLRHTTGSFFNAARLNPKVAQNVLGHSDINLTLGIYTHTYRDDEAQAVAALPDLAAPATDAQQALRGTGTTGDKGQG